MSDGGWLGSVKVHSMISCDGIGGENNFLLVRSMSEILKTVGIEEEKRAMLVGSAKAFSEHISC
jgi:hypothetical protein